MLPTIYLEIEVANVTRLKSKYTQTCKNSDRLQ